VTTTSPNGTNSDLASIEANIARQREELARTVDALSERLDVKARAEHKVADLREAATTDAGRPRPAVVLAAAAAIAGVVTLVWWRRHR
jgi:hypothetical protein